MRLVATLFHLFRLQIAACVVAAVLPLASAEAVVFNNWTSNGPFPAPAKGTVTAIAVAPTTPAATVYLGTDGGGVYGMSDGGSSWSPLNASLTNRQVAALAVHPIDARVVYAGTAGGVFKSADGGVSWNRQSSGMPSLAVRGLAIDPVSPSTIYAATDAGIYKSGNGASTWTSANNGLGSLDVRFVLIDPTAPAVLYAATAGGVFKSTDSGATWAAANTSLNDTDVLTLAWGATSPPTLFAGTNGGGVYVSTDDAASWGQDNAGLGNLVANAVIIDNPAAPTAAYLGTRNGFYKRSYASSAWGGWIAAGTGITAAAEVRAIANNPSSRTTLYAGSSLGVFKSSAAASWSAVASGLHQGSVVATKPTDPTVVVAAFAGGGIYRSTDSGTTWSATIDDAAGRLFATALLYDPTGASLYAASGSGIFKSANDGAAWTDISSTLPCTDVRSLAVSGGVIHAGTAQGIFAWNGTDTWSPYSAGQPGNIDVTAISFKGGSLFAGTNGGGVFRSDGVSWTQVNSGLTNTVINTLAADNSNVYVGTPGGVFKSADSGANWLAVNNGITTPAVKTIALSAGAPTFITAGTAGGGVFFSTTGGDIWTAMNTRLADRNVNGLTANAATKKVYAATASGKVFALNLSPVSAITPAAPLPASPVDFGNVGNTDTKTIYFSLQNTGTLQLKISAITLAGTDLALFGILQGGARECNLATLPNLIVEAGDYCTIGVGFSPANSGNKTASLTLYSDAANQPVTTYLLGKGGFPPLATITSPTSGDTKKNPVLIAGTATDKDQSTGTDGTGSTLAKVEVSTDGGATWHDAVKSPTLNSWTQWSYSWTSNPLPANGPYVVKARATDANGFIQSVLSSINLTVDNTPPVTTITGHPASLDNTAAGTFTFTVDKAGSTSACRIDGATAASCSSPFTYAGLSDGSHTFSVLSTDTVGNAETTAKTFTWVVDTIPPDVAITGTPLLVTRASDASFTFSANETSTFACTLDGVATACTSPKSYTGLADGSHTFTVKGTDQAGNTAGVAPTVRSYSWTVDANNKPTSTVNLPTGPVSGVSYLLTGGATDSVSGVKLVTATFNGGTPNSAVDTAVSPAQPWSGWSYLWSLPVNGTYTVQVQATDNAGNLQATPANNSIIVANPPPTAALSTPAADALIGSATARLITGTAQAAIGGLPLQKVQVAVFPTATPPSTINWIDVSGSTDWSYNWQFPADGNYTIQARSLDVAPNLAGVVTGNPSAVASRNVTVDTTPPTSTITPLVNPYITGQQISVAGTADDAAPGTGVKQITVAVVNSIGQSVTGTPFYNSSNKSWSYTSGTLPDGSYTVQSTVTDNAGNQQATPSTTTVVIDNVAPVTAITAKPQLLSNLQSAVFSFSANEPATFVCTLDGVSGPCACTSSTASSCTLTYGGLTSAPHTFSVKARDNAGNDEAVGQSYSWTVDIVPPVATATTPVDGTVRLSVSNAIVTATFNKDLDPATVTAANFYLQPAAAGVVSYDPVTRKATFTPSAPLAYATTYTAVIGTGIADPAQNHIAANYSWSFSTDPDGDMNMDGKVDIADAQLCLKAAVAATTPTPEQLRHADLAPFRNGKPFSDGRLDASDALIILSRSVGAVTW